MQASLLIPALACSVRRAFQWGHTRAGAHAHLHTLTHFLSHTYSTLGVHDNRAARSHGLNRGGSQDSALEARQSPSMGALSSQPSAHRVARSCLWMRGATT